MNEINSQLKTVLPVNSSVNTVARVLAQNSGMYHGAFKVANERSIQNRKLAIPDFWKRFIATETGPRTGLIDFKVGAKYNATILKSGETISENEPMTTGTVGSIVRQNILVNRDNFSADIRLMSDGEYGEMVRLDELMAIVEFSEYVRQIQVFRVLDDIKTQLQSIYTVKDTAATPTNVAYNLSLDTKNPVFLDFTGITPTSDAAADYKIIKKAVRDAHTLLSGKYTAPMARIIPIHIPFDLGMKIIESIIEAVPSAILRAQFDELFHKHLDFEGSQFQYFRFENVIFVLTSPLLINPHQEFDFGVEDTSDFYTKGKYANLFTDGYGVAYLPDAVCLGEGIKGLLLNGDIAGSMISNTRCQYVFSDNSSDALIPQESLNPLSIAGITVSGNSPLDAFIQSPSSMTTMLNPYDRARNIGAPFLRYMRQTDFKYGNETRRIIMHLYRASTLIAPNSAINVKLDPSYVPKNSREENKIIIGKK